MTILPLSIRCEILCLSNVILFHWVSSVSLCQDKDVASGRNLFNRVWQVHDPLCPTGDGIGPVFNANSCATCHHQVTSGGGGIKRHNVDLLTLVTPSEELDAIRRKRRGPQGPPRIHPGFLQNKRSIILHRLGVFSDYENFRFELLGLNYSAEMSPTERAQFWASVAKRERQASFVRDFSVGGVHFRLTQRNTPALFGAGFIDVIPAEAIRAVAKQQAVDGSVDGRVSPATSRHHRSSKDPTDDALRREDIGRFGWRGQISTLEDFVLGACANELGLEAPGHKQPMNPLAPDQRPPGLDLTVDQCNKLLHFVRKLPRPVQIKPRDHHARQSVDRGERLFHKVGCAACHIKKLGGFDGLYSDLLLHDMGIGLADPIPAIPESRFVERRPSFGYFGAGATVDVFAEIDSNKHQEWRTPPLWGVADFAPYLHDGRAKNLRQAIAKHGGESNRSRERYAALPGTDRDNLIKFLMTLRAPR